MSYSYQEEGPNLKSFNSVDRETFWKLLRHYGVPEKLTNIIKNYYEGMTCKVIHEGQLTNTSCVRTTGVPAGNGLGNEAIHSRQ